jgi:hypothetical protein
MEYVKTMTPENRQSKTTDPPGRTRKHKTKDRKAINNPATGETIAPINPEIGEDDEATTVATAPTKQAVVKRQSPRHTVTGETIVPIHPEIGEDDDLPPLLQCTVNPWTERAHDEPPPFDDDLPPLLQRAVNPWTARADDEPPPLLDPNGEHSELAVNPRGSSAATGETPVLDAHVVSDDEDTPAPTAPPKQNAGKRRSPRIQKRTILSMLATALSVMGGGILLSLKRFLQ